MSSVIPVACLLSDQELRKREAALLSEFKSFVISAEELENGYAFRLPGDRKSLAVVNELILAERECCPFLTFEFRAEPQMGPLVLRMSGPPGTREFLKSVLGM
jgi:hypothetical protein